MATFTEHLRALGPDGLVALLELRRDLAAPPPASVRALAARATTRASLDRALATVDAGVLATLDALLVLPAPVSAEDVAAALGADAADWVADALERALAWADEDGLHATPGLAELLGPWPAGLGPSLSTTLARRTPETLAALADVLGVPDPSPEAIAAHLADPAAITELLDTAPAGAPAVLDALAWGPPVGRSPSRDAPGHTAVSWLLQHGLLAVGDPQHVLLPREVALARRGGRLRAEPPVRPRLEPTPVDPGLVAGEAARHALEAVRLTAELVATWGRTPAPVLRAGGLGVRELRRVAGALDVDAGTAAVLVEVAGAAQLVADDGEEEPVFCPTTLADEWGSRGIGERWAELAGAWLASDRAPWLVGTRDDAGALRSALDPTNHRPWAARLRAAVLQVLADAGDGRLDPADVHAQLAWRTPRTAPTEHAVRAVLDEAALLGVSGAGVLAPHARALLDLIDGAVEASGTDGRPDESDGWASRTADALEAVLPAPVDEVLLGGDLTGIVPGRPSDRLSALLTEIAEVESRGAGLTVRFTEASVRSALDSRTAEEILAALGAHARTGVPQPLEYLVSDAARRHGQVRAGSALAYLRGDPAALATLTGHAAMRGLGARLVAPGVLIATAPPAELVEAVRAAGLPAVLEDADGLAVRLTPTAHRVRLRRRTVPDPALGRRRLERVAADLAGTPDPEPEDQGTAEPVETLGLLREAAAAGREVWLEVAGPSGPSRRRVRVLRVDAGRVRVLDAERESELIVAVHRIVGAEPAEPSSGEDLHADRSAT
ncbi:helicase-associated domain-containing protein [Actinotalea sp. M2MS4P-6]|uniref:helicase-associated domain-containing protein n=1 Tax=Actinotalea sp. M2MS4P-6 TaxID=2983762 RepID=UPI0021E512C5|nr:helicase-associated domain-containing protein [Actinotalea sp. M2MS4P-6]MCV2395083.1 helicase-associated domain-containing protein [Actinotalea sp. M2MS4P-6]